MPNIPKYGRGQVVEIINSVLTKVDSGRDVTRDVYLQLAELVEIIDTLKKDISDVKPGHVKNSHIPDATDELDEIVKATAEATNKIMGLCEEIETIAETLEPPAGEAITGKITQIYEACGFQDITGQRIRNVVGAFQVIEDKIDKIMDKLADTVGLKLSEDKCDKAISIDDEKSLLNGPQMSGKGVTQEDIDKLLADFDK